MAKDDKLLHLIIIEESRNDAEAIANLLRNAGYVVRFQYADSSEALDAALERQIPELILCAEGLDALPLATVLESLTDRQLGTPVILIGETADEPRVIEALRAGASDLVSYDRPEHLQLVVAREQQNLHLQHEVQQYLAAHQESERRCRALLDSSRDAIAYVHDGMHIYANQSYLERFGFDDLDEIEGMPIMDLVAPEDHAAFKEFLRNYGHSEGGDKELEVQCLSATGNFKALMEFTPASIEGEPCTQIVIRDQTSADPDLQEKLKYLSKQDIVTGLFNRQYFLEELELAAADAVSGSGQSFILYVLIDNFKSVKESVGLAASDLVVKDVADLIREKVADNGICARFGDNSFTILCRSSDLDAAQALAEAIRYAIEEHIVDVEGRSLTVTSSIGISLVSDSTPDASEILSRADLACEVARSAGGNRVHLHNPITDEQLGREREDQWLKLIEQALAEDRFQLFYQPIVSLQGDPQERYEVLLRMRDAEGHNVLPGQFLPVAEKNGLMADIDRWVIGHAIETLAEHRRAGHDTVFFVKVSAPTLAEEDIALWINERLKAVRLQGDALVFEVAEKDAGEHLKNLKRFFKAVSALHCKTSLEHFGSSPNSFQLFKHLPVDYLKIDGAFIHNLMSSEDNQAVVKSIADMAHSMNKQCIAEFVEDASSLTALFQYGIQFIQGYFLQEPQEALNYDFAEESI
ncbi:EAL domain-containing protein [Thiohalobacter sp. IOR34]|uniref:putative bifunctional diguanylate cyclase/phosphodiesterase n=1 Tax=Thiohalobacter sp. IOR34 TaxID=3057176 RepID=UPI0025AF1731|nr:EAL domain-containing protein [Thiohalobacter sp. IOR34]WJW76242.1 EAL domain-containing protein [Thiohalobacter sp. IOR34]